MVPNKPEESPMVTDLVVDMAWLMWKVGRGREGEKLLGEAGA